jgi:RNA polymerase sigma factor (sigma-70 family)
LFVLLGQAEGSAAGAGGDAAARFVALYREYLPKVFRYMAYRVADTHTAEDLTSLVFEKALSKFQSHDPEKGAFSTWLFSIAHNAVVDHYRAASKEKDLKYDTDIAAPRDYISPEDVVADTEDFRLLRICISFLTRHEQEIISLKFGARMNNRQIARTTSLSESNVGTIIWRTVGKLRSCLTERSHA